MENNLNNQILVLWPERHINWIFRETILFWKSVIAIWIWQIQMATRMEVLVLFLVMLDKAFKFMHSSKAIIKVNGDNTMQHSFCYCGFLSDLKIWTNNYGLVARTLNSTKEICWSHDFRGFWNRTFRIRCQILKI